MQKFSEGECKIFPLVVNYRSESGIVDFYNKCKIDDYNQLEMRYRYSGSVVYNNFIWCEPSEKNIKKISATAQNILDCRKNYPNSSLADLYDPLLMPKDLRDAHKKNDSAVLEAYGFNKNFSEAEILAELMKLYQNCKEKNL